MFSDNENLKSFVYVSFEKFRQDALKRAEQRNEHIRKGQFIYTDCISRYYEQLFELERYKPFSFAQVDCFYDDKKIDAFLKSVYDELCKSDINKT